MLVKEIMTKDVVKIDCNKTVYDACEKFSQKKVGSLIVMDEDITVGIVTERDAIDKVILKENNPRNTKLIDVMTHNLKTVHALAPVEKAANILKENNIKKLPVILNNEIVGIITETDLTNTINVFSEKMTVLTNLYIETRKKLESDLQEWKDKTKSDLTNTINLFSEKMTMLTDLSGGVKERLEKDLDEWEDTLIDFKSFADLTKDNKYGRKISTTEETLKDKF